MSILPIGFSFRLTRTSDSYKRQKSTSNESCRARTCDIQIPPIRAPVSKSDALPTELITPLTMGYIVYHAIVPIAMPLDDVTDRQTHTRTWCVKNYGCFFCVDRPIDRPTDATDDRHARARSARTTRETEARRTRFSPSPRLHPHPRSSSRASRTTLERAIAPINHHHARGIGGGVDDATTRARGRGRDDRRTGVAQKNSHARGEEPETHRSEIHGRGERIALHSTVGVEA